MNKQDLLLEIKEALQRDEDITLDMKLSDIEEWDSLANLSIITLYDQLFELIIPSNELIKCKTINDLIQLVSDKLDK